MRSYWNQYIVLENKKETTFLKAKQNQLITSNVFAFLVWPIDAGATAGLTADTIYKKNISEPWWYF